MNKLPAANTRLQDFRLAGGGLRGAQDKKDALLIAETMKQCVIRFQGQSKSGANAAKKYLSNEEMLLFAAVGVYS